ncbi:MAG: zeta toxin family protein [Blastocatellia bacterium]
MEAGRVMLRRLRELASRQSSFAFETTLATRTYAPWLRELREGGYQVNLLFIWLDSAELAIQRVRARVAPGGHDIPETTIRRRYQSGIRNFFTLYRPLADSWGIYDNSISGMPQLIARGSAEKEEKVTRQKRWNVFYEAGQ